MSKRDIPPAKPYFPAEDVVTIQQDVKTILQSGMLTLGEYTRRFEAEFAKLCNSSLALAVNSGTSALEISLRSMGLHGEEVLIPTNTFGATAASVIFSGGKPILTDVDAETLCISSNDVQKHLTGRTKGVVVVHIGGLVCPDMKAIREICEDHHLFLIEDAAHAHGSTLDKQVAGSFGDAGCFSFYPTKVMTSGEGGMITTGNKQLFEKAVILRDQGKESFSSSIIVEIGYNWRMNEISAAIGLAQLKRLPEFLEQRRKIARYYDKQVSGIEGITPLDVPVNAESNYYKYTAFLSPNVSRDDFKRKLREEGVKCSGEVYWPPLHMQPAYKRLLKVKEGGFPQAEDACRRMVCLPLYSQMTLEEAEYVVEKVRQVLSTG